MRKSNYFGYFRPIDIADSLGSCNMTSSDGVSAIIAVFSQRLNLASQVAKTQNKTEYEVDLNFRNNSYPLLLGLKNYFIT